MQRLLPFLLLTSLAYSAPPASQPTTLAQAKISERADVLKDLSQYEPVGPYDLPKVLHFQLKDNRLLITSTLESFDGKRRLQFTHPDDYASIDFHSMTPSNQPDQPRFMQLYRWDFRDPKNAFFHTAVITHPGYAQIASSIQFIEGSRDVTLLDHSSQTDDNGTQQPAGISLFVQGLDDSMNPTAKLTLQAPDLHTLQRDHPSEVNEYLRPVLRELLADSLLEIDPASAWQVLAHDAPPDPQMTAKIHALLPTLDAPSYQARKKAARDLKSLGTPAAIALLQLNRTALSAEQNARLDEILSPYQQLPPAEAQRLSTDPGFLLNCMDSPDPTLRTVAYTHLQKLTSTPLPYDPSAPPEIRHSTLESLRSKLLPPAATQSTR